MPRVREGGLRIVVIHHARENAANMERYLIGDFAEAWRAEGHTVTHVAGVADLPDAEIGIVHVDLSVVPPRYAAAAARYPLVIDGGVRDVRKRRVSQALAIPGEAGPVIVKTDRNYGGRPELDRLPRWRSRMVRAVMRGRAGDLLRGQYPVFPSLAAVPLRLRIHPALVVERFLPEREGDAYFVRQSFFLGGRDVSWRLGGMGPIVRAADAIADEEVPTPPAVRAFATAIGLDYGKIDYLEAGGEPVVIDVAKTVGGRGTAPETVRRLAGGLAELWASRR